MSYLNEPFEIPSWFNDRLVGNPWFSANAQRIQALADVEFDPVPITHRDIRVLCFSTDIQLDFVWPLTDVDINSGRVSRYVPEYLLDLQINIPNWWDEGNNTLVVTKEDEPPDIHEFDSIPGGRLSVPGAWNTTNKFVRWKLENMHRITRDGNSADAHFLTNRFNMHCYRARYDCGKIKKGQHPWGYMDGWDRPFPLITPDNLFHPIHNPEGLWEPIISSRPLLDDVWKEVVARKMIVLWFEHCDRLTQGATIEPALMASTMHHAYLRGGVEAEPLIEVKSADWVGEWFGMFKPEYSSEFSRKKIALTPTQILCGDAQAGVLGYDLWVKAGHASNFCVLTDCQQIAADLIATHNEHRIKDVVVLMDCCSPIPGDAFNKDAEWHALKNLGMRLENSETFKLYNLPATA